MVTATRRTPTKPVLQPSQEDNVKTPAVSNAAAPAKPGKLQADLEKKTDENAALKKQVAELTKALHGMTVVTSKIDTVDKKLVHQATHPEQQLEMEQDETTTVGDEDGTVTTTKTRKPRTKKDKDAPVPAKTAYKFYCDAHPPEEGVDMRKVWKEQVSPEMKQVFVNMAAADKARFQRETDDYTMEKDALRLYHEKKTQDVAMELLDATLVAKEALALVEDGKKKKTVKDPEAPKRNLSAYMFFTAEKRESVKQKLGDKAPVTEVMKVLAEMWSKLEKGKPGAKGTKKWDDMADVDRERYEGEKATYDAMMAERKAEADQAEKERKAVEKEEALQMYKEHQDAMTVASVAHAAGMNVEAQGHAIDNISVITDDNTKQTNATKKKKDPNAPKHPMSAYLYFCCENREKIKAKMPADATNIALLTEVGKQWKELAAGKKVKYDKMATIDKARYTKEMELYYKTKN